MNRKYKVVTFLYFLLFFFLIPHPLSYASSMSNEGYKLYSTDIESPTVDFEYKKEPQNKSNYMIYPFFDTKKVLGDSFNDFFSLSISQDILKFGQLSPTNPVIRSLEIGIKSNSEKGYSLIVFEDFPLTNENKKALIPNTSCDNGLCTYSESSLWTSVLTYGLGMRCDNKEESACAENFSNKDYFRPLPDSSNSQQPQVIMKGIKPNNSAKSKMTYKLNVSAQQDKGIYSNTITYIAVPNF